MTSVFFRASNDTPAASSKPSYLTPPSNVHRITTPASERLSVIMEQKGAPPKIPPKSPNRGRHSASRGSISATTEMSMAPDEKIKNWSVWSDDGRESVYQPDRYAWIRENKHIAKRGGWKRLLFCVLIAIIVILAVVLGVVLGTRKKDHSSSSSSAAQSGSSGSTITTTATTSSTPTTVGLAAGDPSSTASASSASLPSGFPVGTYTIRTFLDTAATNCSSNSATWSCYPYSTYNDSPTKSLASFDWVISQSSKANSYTISSTLNPFSISFTNTPLSLVDAGQSTERYKFQLNMAKEVRPSVAIADDNSATACYFNSTTFTAYLYTKINATYPSSSDGSLAAAGSSSYPVWPFQVRVDQSAISGNNVPNCYKITDGNVGQSVDVKTGEDGQFCSCLYRNLNVPSPY